MRGQARCEPGRNAARLYAPFDEYDLTEMLGKADRVARLFLRKRARKTNSGVTGPKSMKFFYQTYTSHRLRASMLRSSYPFWNASAQNKGGYANFRRIAQKSVTRATSLERSRKEGQIDHVHPISVHIPNIW